MGNQNSIEESSEDPPASSLTSEEDSSMGKLKRISHGPSGLRHEARQRPMPKVARQDPYDIPESPEKIRRPKPKLKLPLTGPSQFSPLRQQRAPATAKSRTKDDMPSDQASVETNGAPLPDVQADTSPRRSLRRQAIANMRPAEESVGSAKRHASPIVRLPQPVENNENSESLLVSPEHDYHTNAIMNAESPTIPRKRGRPPKEDGEKVSSKRVRLSDQHTGESSKAHVTTSTEEDPDTGRVKPAKIRPSSLYSREKEGPDESHDEGDVSAHDPDENQEDGENDEEAEAPAFAPKAKAARALKAKKTKASTSNPQIPTELPTAFLAEEESSEDAGDDFEDQDCSLRAHFIAIKKICKNAVPLVEVKGHLEDLDNTTERMRSFCRSVRRGLRQLRRDLDNAELLAKMPIDLETIQEGVRNLCREDADKISLRQSNSTYFCLFPALMRVLWSLVRCFKALDAQEDTGGMSVTFTHLKDINRFIGTITRLGEKAKLFPRPDPSLDVVRNVTSNILSPLKRIEISLQRLIVQHEQRQQERRNAQHMQAQKAAERAEAEARAEELAELAEAQEQAREAAELAEAQAQAERDRWQRLEKKWDDLHVERKRCEGSGITPLAKRKHLLQPKARPEQDQLGETFRRIEVFRPRIGPQPATVERVKSQVWPERSQEALVEGLIRWAGDVLVFERIFRAYCWRNEPLNAYNVTEIVVKASQLKKVLEKDCDVESDEWAWVAAIPDWTKADTLLQQLEAYEVNEDHRGSVCRVFVQ